nr:hypothetical protein Iba_chr07cCG13740 [Ipomoea batatas]
MPVAKDEEPDGWTTIEEWAEEKRGYGTVGYGDSSAVANKLPSSTTRNLSSRRRQAAVVNNEKPVALPPSSTNRRHHQHQEARREIASSTAKMGLGLPPLAIFMPISQQIQRRRRNVAGKWWLRGLVWIGGCALGASLVRSAELTSSQLVGFWKNIFIIKRLSSSISALIVEIDAHGG